MMDDLALKIMEAERNFRNAKEGKEKEELRKILRQQQRQSGINLLSDWLRFDRAKFGAKLLGTCGETIHIASEKNGNGHHYCFGPLGIMDGEKKVTVEEIVDFVHNADENCDVSVKKPSDIRYYIEKELEKIADRINQAYYAELSEVKSECC